MKFISRSLDYNQINTYLIISFFLTTLSFFLVKSFIFSTELSDNIFSFFCILSFELAFLTLINSSEKFFTSNKNDFLIYFFTFLLIFFLWNVLELKNILYLLSFIIFQALIVIFVILSEYKLKEMSNVNSSKLFTFIILCLFCSGLFHQLSDNLEYKNLILLTIITTLYFIFFNLYKLVIKNNFKYVDIIFSSIIFLVLIKVFLFSSNKDSFHYSWILGPVFSSMHGHEFLSEISSQYGYFSAVLIKYFSLIFNTDPSLSIVILIIFFFLIFFFLFMKKISSLIKYPYVILTLFLCLSLFGLVGVSNLSGGMFIPSSSVYRFLPSILTIYFLTEILNNNKYFYLNCFLFFCFLIISICWSFESAFFVVFPLLSSICVASVYLIYSNFIKKEKITSFLVNKKIYIIFLVLFILSIAAITLVFIGKDITFFYEYVKDFKGLKGLGLLNNSVSLLFGFLLFLNFLILRDSTNDNKNNYFFYNFLWFALLISFSSYYIVRSHPNNAFSLFPFFIFFTCCLKVNSNSVQTFRETFLKVFIFCVITSSIYSIFINKNIFFENLRTNNFIKTPIYKYHNYIPSRNIEQKIIDYKNIPLTIISGSTIHKPNKKFNSNGFGLPILPLEQFNILSLSKKELIMKRIFKKNKQHLILCIFDCDFYNDDKDRKSWESIFISKNLNLNKLSENKKNNFIEKLYLLETK